MTKSPAIQTLMAFDFGEKRIGIAIGNTITKTTQPLTIIQHNNIDQRFEKIQTLILEWQPQQLIVGLPVHPDGTPHAMTEKAKRFGNQLKGRFNLPVTWVDERYSSVDVADRKSTRLNSSHTDISRMPSSA